MSAKVFHDVIIDSFPLFRPWKPVKSHWLNLRFMGFRRNTISTKNIPKIFNKWLRLLNDWKTPLLKNQQKSTLISTLMSWNIIKVTNVQRRQQLMCRRFCLKRRRCVFSQTATSQKFQTTQILYLYIRWQSALWISTDKNKQLKTKFLQWKVMQIKYWLVYHTKNIS